MKNILFSLLAAVPGTSALAKEAKIADKISVEVTEKGRRFIDVARLDV